MVLVLSHNSLHIYPKDDFYNRIQKEYILDIIILLIEKMYLWTSLQEECCSEPIYLATFEQGRIFFLEKKLGAGTFAQEAYGPSLSDSHRISSKPNSSHLER